jgi:nicotinate-nucleotide adenylyltransferase
MSDHAMSHRQKSIALFGGSFDPIHKAHIAVARTAMRQLRLDQVIFIPSGMPPHKPSRKLASFADRYAMLALACGGNAKFTVSPAEGGPNQTGERVFYSVDTVKHFHKTLKRDNVKLYFVLGADQFLTLPSWKNYETLLRMCDFIVANRPGFNLARLYSAIPEKMLEDPGGAQHDRSAGTIRLKRTAVHPLTAIASDVSSTEIRRRVRSGESIAGLVPRSVQAYIEKQGLYR